MRNPLSRRHLRSLRRDFGKYLVIFLLLTLTIGFVSGYLVADGSMIEAYNEGFEKYTIEDGHFRVGRKLNKAQQKLLSETAELYNLFYVNDSLTNGSTLRIYEKRGQVNLECLMEGAWPSGEGEIAIDRMYADNNGLTVGDSVSDGVRSYTVTGLVALPDYSCLFENNTDSMFDSVLFGVAVVPEGGLSAFSRKDLMYCYAWRWRERPADETQEKDWSEEFMKTVNAEVPLSEYVPRYLNQAINFTGEDMGSDRSMMLMLLYIVIVIMAFAFSIIIGSTITAEAPQIGTLRASGYTRGEMIRHYMVLPLLVTFAGAALGNVIGYTVMKGFCAGMYYGSYSLPTYVTIWNADAFILTTVVPCALMCVITYVTLARRMRLTPLQFLRSDFSRGKKKRALPLSTHIPFFSRFRIRVLLQNAGNYIVLFLGIVFSTLLLFFGLDLPVVLDHFEENLQSNLLADYQYMLQLPADALDDTHKIRSLFALWQYSEGTETKEPSAEKFSAYALDYERGEGLTEEVLLYGLAPDSRYVSVPAGEVWISSAFADKYRIQKGDTFSLKEPYGDERYTFTADGIYDYMGALTVFLDREALNEMFDLGKEYFGGYFSQEPITDIRSEYLGTTVDLEALTKVSRQLDVSMGGMMILVEFFAVIIYMILIYLLSKLIIEKNAQPISMAKILGYSNGEIGRLYIWPTTIAVLVSMALSLPLIDRLMAVLFRVMMTDRMTGWIPYYRDRSVFLWCMLIGIVTYAVVAVLEYRKVRKVPMDEALKNRE